MTTATTRKLLTGVIVLQGLIIAGQWGRPNEAHAARSGETNLPDPGARQLQMIDELKGLNAKVDHLTSLLAGGELTVKVAKDAK